MNPDAPGARFAAALARLRLARGWTHYRLSRESGVGEVGLRQLEAGTREPRLGTLVRLADVLGVSLDELAGREP
jgi:transcriptional regulator with XRE-family HTH domain